MTESGGFTCLLDTYQQGMDMIESAIAACCQGDDESKANTIEVAVDIGASELFDAVGPRKT